MTSMSEAKRLIARSISHNEITHAPYSPELDGWLTAWAEDWTDTSGGFDYWGTSGEDGEWRVMLHTD